MGALLFFSFCFSVEIFYIFYNILQHVKNFLHFLQQCLLSQQEKQLK